MSRSIRKLVFACCLLLCAFVLGGTGQAATRQADCSWGVPMTHEGSDCSDAISSCCGEDWPDATCGFTDCAVITHGGNYCFTVEVWCEPIVCC